MDERFLNYYFNIGKFNHPSEIGHVMNEIRECQPVTLNEWRLYYLANVRDYDFLINLSKRMYNSIPVEKREPLVSEDCLEYIEDVIFRRTFNGYNKENEALNKLNILLNNKVKLSPKELDGEYFIDFIVEHPFIGIQLKPDTFYTGGYNRIVNIDEKLKKFELDYNAKAFILVYSKESGTGLHIINKDEINKIKEYIGL